MRMSDWSSDVCSSELLEEGPRGLVHADVGRLRGEHHGDQQGVGVHVLQLALGLRESGGKTVEEGGDIGFFHGPTCCAGSVAGWCVKERPQRGCWKSRSARPRFAVMDSYATPVSKPEPPPAPGPALFDVELRPPRRLSPRGFLLLLALQLGRASCRERGCPYV